MQGGNLLTDNRILWRLIDIDLRPMLILFGDAGVRKDRFNWTLRHARITINAGIGVYIESIGEFMKSFHGANRGTVCVFTIDA